MKSIILKLIAPLVIIIASFIINTLLGFAVLICLFVFALYKSRMVLFLNIGKYYTAKQNEEASLRWMKKAHEVAPNNANMAITYGYVLLRQGHIEQADAILSKVSLKNINSEGEINLKLNRSIVLWKLGMQKESVALAEEVYERFKSTVIYGTLGYYYLLIGDLERALPFNEEAYDYNDSSNAVLDNLGMTYYLLERYDEALPIFEKLIEAKPTFREAYYNAGLVYEKLGDTKQAYELYQTSLSFKSALVSHVSLEEIEAKIREMEATDAVGIKENNDGDENNLDS